MKDYDAAFFHVVRTGHLGEAETMLRDARNDVLERKRMAHKHRDGDEELRLNNLLTKINDELAVINRRNEKYLWQQGITALFGPDAWPQLRVWLMQNRVE